MAAVASSDGFDGFDSNLDSGDSTGFGTDAAATTPLALAETAIRPVVRAANVTKRLAQQPKARIRHVRLSVAGRAARAQALHIERRLATQHAPRWYERLALWLLRLPLALRRGWWDTPTIMAAMLTDRPALRRALAQEKARVGKLARRVMGGRSGAQVSGWPADGDLWRLQVAELLATTGVRVEVEADRWGGRHYATHAMTPPLGDATNPTLEAVLDGHVARDRDQTTWPATPAEWFRQQGSQGRRAAPVTRPIPQPALPTAAEFFLGWPSHFRPLRSLDVTPPPLPRIPVAHDPTDTPDPWRWHVTPDDLVGE